MEEIIINVLLSIGCALLIYAMVKMPNGFFTEKN